MPVSEIVKDDLFQQPMEIQERFLRHNLYSGGVPQASPAGVHAMLARAFEARNPAIERHFTGKNFVHGPGRYVVDATMDASPTAVAEAFTQWLLGLHQTGYLRDAHYNFLGGHLSTAELVSGIIGTTRERHTSNLTYTNDLAFTFKKGQKVVRVLREYLIRIGNPENVAERKASDWAAARTAVMSRHGHVVVSANPFDIVLMSEFAGWHSCHSINGQYSQGTAQYLNMPNVWITYYYERYEPYNLRTPAGLVTLKVPYKSQRRLLYVRFAEPDNPGSGITDGVLSRRYGATYSDVFEEYLRKAVARVIFEPGATYRMRSETVEENTSSKGGVFYFDGGHSGYHLFRQESGFHQVDIEGGGIICPSCGEVDNGKRRSGRFGLCDNCRRLPAYTEPEPRDCGICGKHVDDHRRGTELLDGTWACQDCQEHIYECASCMRFARKAPLDPTQKSYVVEGQHYCPECSQNYLSICPRCDTAYHRDGRMRPRNIAFTDGHSERMCLVCTGQAIVRCGGCGGAMWRDANLETNSVHLGDYYCLACAEARGYTTHKHPVAEVAMAKEPVVFENDDNDDEYDDDE